MMESWNFEFETSDHFFLKCSISDIGTSSVHSSHFARIELYLLGDSEWQIFRVCCVVKHRDSCLKIEWRLLWQEESAFCNADPIWLNCNNIEEDVSIYV